MTISNPVNVVTHTGNSVTTVWPFSFLIPADTAQVTLTHIASGFEAEALDPALYVITGEDDEAGGTVEYPLSGAALSSEYRINIKRRVPLTQALDLTNQSPYFPALLEQQLDRQVMMITQVQEELDRAVKTGTGADVDPAELIETLLAAVAGLPDPEQSTFTTRTYTVGTAYGDYDGVSLNTFPMSYIPQFLLVFVNGLLLSKGPAEAAVVDFTATNGTSVTFTEDLTVGMEVQFVALNVTEVTINQPILNGVGVPGAGLGEPGQYYINTTTVDLYNKTDETTWALVLNFKGATGATGATGPANTLTIGTVTPGANETDAAATITGTAPDQTLNLTLPRGLIGATGNNGLSFVWQGDWDIATQYLAQNVVRDGGATWVASVDNLGEAPPTLPTESNAFWELFVFDGEPGPNFNVTGAYNPATAYSIGDTVSYEGGSYVSRVDANTGNTPSISPTQWQVVAEKGEQGDPGTGDMDSASFPTLVSLEGLALVAGDILYATAADTLARLAKGSALQVLRMNAGATAPEWAEPGTRQVNAQTGTTYTLVATDAGKWCTFSNAAAVTVTVPPNSSVAFPVNTQIDLSQLGAGQVTLAQGSGVTINSKSSNKKLTGQYSAATLLKTATDTWLLVGDLAA